MTEHIDISGLLLPQWTWWNTEIHKPTVQSGTYIPYVISVFRLPYHPGKIRMDSLESFRRGRALLAENLRDSRFWSIFNFIQNWILQRNVWSTLKNLSNSLATNLTYFTNKNIHFQDWPLPSVEVFAVSGWSHHLNVYQFVRGWQLFFTSLEYSKHPSAC